MFQEVAGAPGRADASANPVELAGDGSISVLSLIGVFGANASGKLNLLLAMTDMRNAVLNSYARWASYDGIPRRIFALDTKSENEPSFFEVDVVIDSVRWTYGFELSAKRVDSEWLHSYPRGRRQEWLDRDASRPDVFKWPGGRVRDRAQLVRRTRPNALLLSTAGTDNQPQLFPLFHWFRRNCLSTGTAGPAGPGRGTGFSPGPHGWQWPSRSSWFGTWATVGALTGHPRTHRPPRV
ncbi:AAA family ATPase [Streptomyces sp. NPDC056002]|uniref:AAA family ATPase n=1 Tax=Streptomyces sp. NPDC056002 TaxID=3345675 RepID=UPI0035D5ECE2